MAITDPTDTLAYNQSRVFTMHRDMRDVPLSAVIAKIKQFDLGAKAVPEKDALWFYGMNHGMALIGAERDRLEPLSKEELDFVKAYHSTLGPKAIKAFYYLLLITTREARHNKSITASMPAMKQEFGTDAAMFFKMSGGEGDIQQKLFNNPPNTTIGQFVDCVRWQFFNSSWSGGYGGKAWGKVTDCLCRFVSGEYSAEIMMDTIWTLCHNNGPIFNKSQIYSHHTTSSLMRILDVQRSGQVPEAVLFDDPIDKYTEVNLKKQMLWLQKRFPTKIGKYVDWEKTQLLGSVNKYPKEIKEQHAAHGMSPEAKAAQAAAMFAAMAKAEAEEAKKLDHAKNWFEVMPGLEVKILKRAA